MEVTDQYDRTKVHYSSLTMIECDDRCRCKVDIKTEDNVWRVADVHLLRQNLKCFLSKSKNREIKLMFQRNHDSRV